MRANAALSKTRTNEHNAERMLRRMFPSVDSLATAIFAPTAVPQLGAEEVNVDSSETVTGGQCAGRSPGMGPASVGLSKTAIHEPTAGQ